MVVVNGVRLPHRPGLTVADLVGEWSPSSKGIAVAVDRTVVPRSEWVSTLLDPGAVVEIVTAAAGG